MCTKLDIFRWLLVCKKNITKSSFTGITFSHSIVSLQCFYFLFFINVKCDINLSIWDNILKLSGKTFSLSTFIFAWNWFRSGIDRIQIGMPYIRVRQNDADPTRLFKFSEYFHFFQLFLIIFFFSQVFGLFNDVLYGAGAYLIYVDWKSNPSGIPSAPVPSV